MNRLFNLIQTFAENKKRGNAPDEFWKVSIILVAKTDKVWERKKFQVNLTHEYRCKNIKQNIIKPNPLTGMPGWLHTRKSM